MCDWQKYYTQAGARFSCPPPTKIGCLVSILQIVEKLISQAKACGYQIVTL